MLRPIYKIKAFSMFKLLLFRRMCWYLLFCNCFLAENIKQDELPPYSFLSRIKKRKFFKQLNQDYYQMNQINGRKPRKKIKIKEKNNITFGKWNISFDIWLLLEFNKSKRISIDFKRFRKRKWFILWYFLPPFVNIKIN